MYRARYCPPLLDVVKTLQVTEVERLAVLGSSLLELLGTTKGFFVEMKKIKFHVGSSFLGLTNCFAVICEIN